jgi:Nicastrin
MLAAADALRSAQLGPKAVRRRIVFLALAGEAWDYTGSRRLLWEMHRGSDATAGLDLDLIDQVRIALPQVPGGCCLRCCLCT